jgi:hypothetical protein
MSPSPISNGTLVILDYDDDVAGKALEAPDHFYTVDKTLSILAKSAFAVDRVERESWRRCWGRGTIRASSRTW